MACLEEKVPRAQTDELAKYFLDPWTVWLLKFDYFRHQFKTRLLPPGAYEYVMARTIHMDALFVHALEQRWPQIVILGAGYDSRSYRFKRKIEKTRIFEVDAYGSQQHKRLCMQRAQLDWPPQTTFVCVDFAHQDLVPMLEKAGYDSRLQTLFLLEGLVMYLPEPQVKYLLSFMQQNHAAGTVIAFDYIFRSVVNGTSTAYGAREQYEIVRDVGEPLQFGMEYDEMNEWLTSEHFKVESHYAPDDFENTYLKNSQGELVGKMFRCTGNVVIRN
jgi:methyltransferase (TIGR00027 family)